MKTKIFRVIAVFILSVFPILISASGIHKEEKGAATLSSSSHSKSIESIKFYGKTIKLGEKAIYINAKLSKEYLGKYTFTSLHAAVKFAKDGTELEPTVLYLEPDVYWIDDPADNNSKNNLIGLVVPQAYITMIGMSDNPSNTVIAGDRGQMAGAIGNWNTIGVGDGFHALNITFGNYCNVDLVYALDPTKNRSKRQKTITQAQVITKAHTGQMDKWVYENCRFISYLNVFSRTDEPHRTYYSNCFFQCTDDAIGTGDISVFKNCSFKYYSSYPAGGASHIIQAYLGCCFEAVLPYPEDNSTIYFSKANRMFAVVDGVFSGNMKRLQWTGNPPDDVRHYVYNNKMHGKDVVINQSKPELSVNLNPESLKAFKVGEEYNVYNLLRGEDDWDPAGQKTRLGQYVDLPYRIKLTTDKLQIKPEANEKAIVSYTIYPSRARSLTPVAWSVSDSSLLTIEIKENDEVIVTGHNNTDSTVKGYLKAETATGIQSLVYIEVLGKPLPAPSFIKKLSISEPKDGKVAVDYTLNLGDRSDCSQIDWYRSSQADGKDSIKVAVTRLSDPLRVYQLTTGDTGYYLIAKIQSKHASSVFGEPQVVMSRKIKPGDVKTKNIYSNLKNIPTQRSAVIRDGFWTLDTHRPVDLSPDFIWEPENGDGWIYGLGYEATVGQYGLMTAGRGARLLYSQAGIYSDMSAVVLLNPNKSGGQGFGSPTGQYADIYTKFDAKTLTGYGLRIERTPTYGNGVRFTLYKFVNGKGMPISKHVYSSAFLVGCKVELKVTGNILTAHVSTSTPQNQSQKDNGLIHEVRLSSTIETNTFGGFGIQHTGSTSQPRARNRLMVDSFLIEYPD